jgi:hypothetical protein
MPLATSWWLATYRVSLYPRRVLPDVNQGLPAQNVPVEFKAITLAGLLLISERSVSGQQDRGGVFNAGMTKNLIVMTSDTYPKGFDGHP